MFNNVKRRRSINKYMKGYDDFTGYIYYRDSGKTIYSKGFGYSNYEDKSINTVNTRFKIGSLTKQFTALCILILEKRNLLSLDDKLSKYIDDFPNGNEISIANLVNMTSGISNYLNDVMYVYYNFSNRRVVYSKEKDKYYTPIEMLNIIKSRPFNFNVGEACEYSNSNYYILGYIIELISGVDYEKFLIENILVPLEMYDTGYDYEKTGKTISLGYESIKPKVKKSATYDNSIVYSAGGMYSTISDLHKWLKAIFIRNYFDIEMIPKYRKHCINMKNSKYTYCNGWIVNNCIEEIQADHEGMVPGFMSYLYIDSRKDKLLLILSNNEEYYYNFSRFYCGILAL